MKCKITHQLAIFHLKTSNYIALVASRFVFFPRETMNFINSKMKMD